MPEQRTAVTGTVLRIERSSIHDGPGIRTVVFLKGCPLRCKWCSTPESQSFGVQEGINKVTGVPVTYGSFMTADEVVRQIVKDEIFFFHSGGGVTISGGEPLSQPEFTADILKKAKAHSINTAMETSLHVPFENLEKVLPLVDYLYTDIKHTNPESHKELTGADNRLILENLAKLSEAGFKGKVTARVPLTPGLNDDDENLLKTGFLCLGIERFSHLELLPYHRIGIGTYQNLGLDYELKEVKTPNRNYMKERAEFIKQHFPKLTVK
jgi:pyruvate formate lyase activating enzyme